MITKILNIVKSVANDFFPEKSINGLMLTGSYAQNLQSDNSDVDVIVISDKANQVYHENHILDGLLFQFIVFPKNKIRAVLADDIINCKWQYTSMIKKGIIIDDPQGILSQLKQTVLELNPRLSERQRHTYRRMITRHLEDLSDCNSSDERLFVSLEIIRLLGKLVSGKLQYDGKHLSKEVSQHKDVRLLLDNFRKEVVNEKCETFVEQAQNILSRYGGPVEKYSTSYIYKDSSEMGYMVFFASHKLPDSVISTFITKLYERLNAYIINLFYIGKNQILEEGTYIFITSKDAPKHSELLNEVEDWRNGIIPEALSHNIKVSFPYQSLFSEGYLFGGRDNMDKLMPYMGALSRILVGLLDKFSPNDFASIDTILATYFLLDFLQSGHFCYKILTDYYDRLLPEAVDPNALYDLHQKEQIERILLEYYDKYSDENIERITALLSHDFSEQDLNKMLKNSRDINVKIIGILNEITDNKYFSRNETLINIIDHVMSMFCLSPSQKFGIVYYIIGYSRK